VPLVLYHFVNYFSGPITVSISSLEMHLVGIKQLLLLQTNIVDSIPFAQGPPSKTISIVSGK
jgi:hypothetical protein